MKVKDKKIARAAKKMGIKLIYKKELDKYSGTILFPEKHNVANEIIKNLKKPLP